MILLLHLQHTRFPSSPKPVSIDLFHEEQQPHVYMEAYSSGKHDNHMTGSEDQRHCMIHTLDQ